MNPMIRTMLAVLVLLGAALISQPAFAVPSSLPVQGYLSALKEGEAMPKTLEMTFRLEQKSGGFGPVYEETMEVELSDGFFSVMLGRGKSLDSALFEKDLKMVLIIEGEPLEFELGSVPYAHRAATSERAEEAERAARAQQADLAVEALTAKKAEEAKQAQKAADADSLGGKPAADYVTYSEASRLHPRRGEAIECTTIRKQISIEPNKTYNETLVCPAGYSATGGSAWAGLRILAHRDEPGSQNGVWLYYFDHRYPGNLGTAGGYMSIRCCRLPQ